MPASHFATCHLAFVGGSTGHLRRAQTAVWICEYPYPTMRHTGPSSECSDCPVWQELQAARGPAPTASGETRELEPVAMAVAGSF